MSRRYLRTALAAAYFMRAFDFLKSREEYRFLGRTEVHEKYAKPVNPIQTAENGDVLDFESLAMDGNFCTLLYTVRAVEKMAARSDINEGISQEAPGFWQEAQGVAVINTGRPLFLKFSP